jgi:hypothetical protein
MNESEVLRHLLDTLCEKYDIYQKELSTLDPKDPKYVSLANTSNRQARTIIATISLMRDPKRQVMFDNFDREKRDMSRIAREIIENEEKRAGYGEKKALMTYKDWNENKISFPKKRKLIVRKDMRERDYVKKSPLRKRRRKREGTRRR